MQIDFFVFDRAPKTLDEDVVAPTPLPSMLMAMPSFLEPSGEASLVELRTLIGVEDLRLAVLLRASSRASRQKDTSIVIDNFQLSTRRLNQSITAIR